MDAVLILIIGLALAAPRMRGRAEAPRPVVVSNGEPALPEEEILSRFEVLGLPDSGRSTFFRNAVAERAIGGRIHDRHIAAVALAGGARVLVTENRRHFAFLATHGVQVLRAGELLAGI